MCRKGCAKRGISFQRQRRGSEEVLSTELTSGQQPGWRHSALLGPETHGPAEQASFPSPFCSAHVLVGPYPARRTPHMLASSEMGRPALNRGTLTGREVTSSSPLRETVYSWHWSWELCNSLPASVAPASFFNIWFVSRDFV